MLKFIMLLSLISTTSWAQDLTILILGDSLTAGYGIDQEQAFPALLQKKLQTSGFKAQVINAGISGSTTASGLKRLNWQLRTNPTHLILALGANDGLRGIKIEATQQNLSQIIQLALKNKIAPILAGMKVPPNYGEQYTKAYEQMFQETATKFKIPMLPFLLQDVAGNPQLNQADGIHPNEKGHALIAENLLQFLLPLLQKTGQSSQSQ